MSQTTSLSTGNAGGSVGTGVLAGKRDAWSVTWLVLACGLIATCVVIGISAALPNTTVSASLLLRDPGPLTTLGLPVVKTIFDYAGALTIGWLLGAVFLAPPKPGGGFDVGGYRCAQAASKCAWVWCAAALALVPFSASNATGFSIGTILSRDGIASALQSLDVASSSLQAAVVAALVAVLARVVLRPASAFAVFGLSILGMLPVALSGHATTSGDHDFASDTIIFHLLGISIWVGGLVAFLALARQRSPHLDTIARRYSAVALIAFITVALSGVGNALIRLSYLSDLWRTDYGRLVVVKAVLLISLGGFGYLQRRKSVTAITTDGDRRPLLRLAVLEIAVMAATIGVAVALGRTAPPAPTPESFTNLTLVLGYDLSGPPSAWNLLTQWRFDFIFGTGSIVAAGLYLWGYRTLRLRGDAWPKGRLISWLVGCFVLLMATSSGLGRYAEAQFSIHMMGHMLLGMGAPILLVLGGPTTLALRALPAARRGDIPGLREGIVGLMHSRFLTLLTHPLVVLPLFVGSFYAIYFSSLFDTMIDSHAGHLIMNLHFLLVGYLYYWVIIGVDPSPRRLSSFVRLALLVAALPFHAFFGLALMNSRSVIGQLYYQNLELPWVSNLLSDQHLGGGIAWGGTEIPLIIVIIALMAQWSKADEREGRRSDRKSGTAVKSDDELDAYNAMLTQLAGRDSQQR
ncbi:cytochrome c oxidase assembly protein [Nakamurella antarctica]|uniref:cytochrome c oxidase assembly protein n=1 Tax=Nakamurella antarctica TaxID=1902245 RepID=UPI0019D05388|nr:cytochrome c oxidase assembly protein [Nakamurella antarctica]